MSEFAEYNIFVKFLTGRTTSLRVSEMDTISDIKLKIGDKEGIPADSFRLLFNGKQLNDSDTVGEVDQLKNESILFAVVRLKSESTPPVSSPKEEIPTSNSNSTSSFSSSKEETPYDPYNRILTVYVKTPTGKTITFQVKSKETVLELKNKITSQTRNAANTIKLFIYNSEMRDEQKLLDCDVGNESIIEMKVEENKRGRGGSGRGPKKQQPPPQEYIAQTQAVTLGYKIWVTVENILVFLLIDPISSIVRVIYRIIKTIVLTIWKSGPIQLLWRLIKFIGRSIAKISKFTYNQISKLEPIYKTLIETPISNVLSGVKKAAIWGGKKTWKGITQVATFSGKVGRKLFNGLDIATKPIRNSVHYIAKNTGKIIEKSAKFTWKLIKSGWNVLVKIDYSISVTVDNWMDSIERGLGKIISPVWKAIKNVAHVIDKGIEKVFTSIFKFIGKLIKNIFTYLIKKPLKAFYDYIFHPLDVAALKLLKYVVKNGISPIFRGTYRLLRTYVFNPIGRVIKYVAKKLFEFAKIVIWKPFVWIMKKVIFKILDWVIARPIKKIWSLIKIPFRYLIAYYKKVFAVGVEKEGFIFGVQPGKLLKTDGNSAFFQLPFQSYFKVYINNTNNFFCDVDIYIDNEKMGTWRIARNSEYLIERPINQYRRFFFDKNPRADASVIDKKNLKEESFKTGIIKAVFHVMSAQEQSQYLMSMAAPNMESDSNSNSNSNSNLRARKSEVKERQEEEVYETGKVSMRGVSHQNYQFVNYKIQSNRTITLTSYLVA